MGSGTVALGIIGNLTALIMFLSPMPTFRIIRKQKDTGRFSAFPYLCTLMNCLLWFFYGLPIVSENNILVVTINGAGIIIESCFLLIYLYYAPWPSKTHVLRSLVFVMFFCAVTFAITMGAFQGDDRITFLGSVNIIINTLMYAAPLSVMRMVIETKSVEYMPFALSLCSFINATLWALYGILKVDKFIIIPNGLGVLLGALQLGLYAKYRKYKTPPANLTDSIAAAYTTEGATATDLSDIITRGTTDVSETVSKGPSPMGSGIFSPSPPMGPRHSQSLKVDLMGGHRRDEVKSGQRLTKATSAPEYARRSSDAATHYRAPSPPEPELSQTGLPMAVTAPSESPPPSVQAAPKSFKEAVVQETVPKIKEAIKEVPPKVKEMVNKVADSIPVSVKEMAESEEATEEFARIKAQEEQKRADELRRLQEAFDEEEYGAELETIFL